MQKANSRRRAERKSTEHLDRGAKSKPAFTVCHHKQLRPAEFRQKRKKKKTASLPQLPIKPIDRGVLHGPCELVRFLVEAAGEAVLRTGFCVAVGDSFERRAHAGQPRVVAGQVVE